jgi:predicted DCC family thiol-disulfide oxidoreductase YuxK
MRKSKLSKFGYQAGGLVGIGSKILARLAKKLSEKELKMLMGSLWKGVDRKQAPHYKAWAKNRWGPGYKWPYQKSRIRGPGMKKSHYASLSDQAKEDLRKRYAKRLAEYIARKKRGG